MTIEKIDYIERETKNNLSLFGLKWQTIYNVKFIIILYIKNIFNFNLIKFNYFPISL